MIINKSVFEQMVIIKPPIVQHKEPLVTASDIVPRNDKRELGEPHFCRQCANLTNLRCREHNFKPVDDIPRNCSDFWELAK